MNIITEDTIIIIGGEMKTINQKLLITTKTKIEITINGVVNHIKNNSLISNTAIKSKLTYEPSLLFSLKKT